MKNIISFSFFFMFSILCAGQNIQLEEPAELIVMLESRKELNFKKGRNVKAWSIQLITTKDKYLVIQKKEEFLNDYENAKVDWTYEQPYYRLNVGAFYTKLEATAALQRFVDKYPDAYVFKNNMAKASDF